MDIFSAGCVIAEILLDGTPLFDLQRLTSYRKGGLGAFSPEEPLKAHIQDDTLVSLVMKMIDLDPFQRPSAFDCLKTWT